MLAGRILAALPPELPAAVVRDGARTIVAVGATEVVRVPETDGAAAFDALDRLGSGWWAGFVSYDLGRRVERVRARTLPDASIPLVCFIRFAARVELEAASAHVRLVGAGPARGALATALATPAPPDAIGDAGLGAWHSSLGRDEYEAGVRAIVGLIEAGDCYQANLTRRLTCERAADPVALWCALETGNPAPHASFLRIGDLAIVSASPERFLRLDGRTVETRPIKGTARRSAELRASAKDRAENVMIVDLARNDLGRVCEPGSVEVPELCALEPHPGLVHLVSTVRGRLRSSVGLGTLLRAMFPPASVTGAPKPRVLQVIEDLEPVRRGVYCGAIGWVDTEAQRADLAVAIRTFTVQPGGTVFGVGAGITADSDPAAEWAETELKAARLLALAGREARIPAGAR